MKNYQTPATGGSVPRTTGVYPNVATVADSAIHSNDGTPVHTAWVNDFFGIMQAVLNGASIASGTLGTAETCGATAGDVTGSQFVQALQLMLCPPGMYHWYAGDTIPTGARLLKCTGSLASRTYLISSGKYARLLNVWCGAAKNAGATAFYRTTSSVGDPAGKSATGNYLVIPNLDGCFMRSRDLGATEDPAGASREYGDIQQRAVQHHTHDHLYVSTDELVRTTSIDFGTGSATGIRQGTSGTKCITGNVSVGSALTDAADTRPANTLGCLCISY